jgi:hypothetical protein
MQNEKLEPCPFCGEKPRIDKRHGAPEVFCGTYSCGNYRVYFSLRNWNTRPDSAEIRRQALREAIDIAKGVIRDFCDGKSSDIREVISQIEALSKLTPTPEKEE